MTNILRIGKVNFSEELIIFEVDDIEEKFAEKTINKEKFSNFIKAEFPEEYENYSIPFYAEIDGIFQEVRSSHFDIEDFINDKRLNENSTLVDILNKFLTEKKYN